MRNWNWRKITTFVGALAYIEVGARIGLPGVDGVALFQHFNQAGRPFLLSLYTAIAGGGMFRAGVLALSVMPYLTARIYMRLLRLVSPSVDALTAEERKQGTRWLTGGLAVIQSVGFASFLQRAPNVVPDPGVGFMATAVLTLTGASLIAMWFGERLIESDEDEVGPHVSARDLATAPDAAGLPASSASSVVEPIVRAPESIRISTD